LGPHRSGPLAGPGGGQAAMTVHEALCKALDILRKGLAQGRLPVAPGETEEELAEAAHRMLTEDPA